MIVRDAKEIARQCVLAEAGAIPTFAGAFFHGSVNWLAAEALLPATSDVDVMVVLEGDDPPPKPGKFLFRGVMLEVSYLPASAVRTPEQVLGTSHLAGSFHSASVICDPSGHLTRLQAAVSRDYAKRWWVERRCQHAREKIVHGFRLDEADPFPEQVNGWLFPAGITTHILLLAGLRNPTVRRRYLAVRELLAEFVRLDCHEMLLDLLGCANMSQARASEHLAALEAAFDAAGAATISPFFFAADLSAAARPIAIAGSREMIARGDHREAIFWLTATATRCQQVFHHDAPELLVRHEPPYRALLADLGIASFADLSRRHMDVMAAVPGIWTEAEAIMDANPEIVR